MAGNLYDDALESLDNEQPQAPVNPFDETLRMDETAGKQRLRGAMTQAAETTPDKAAESRRLGARFGVAPEIVERDFDAYAKRGTVEAVPYKAIQTETPQLAAWLEKPENAKLAADDIEPLRGLAKGLLAPSTGDDFLVVKAVQGAVAGLVEGFGALAGGAEWASRVFASTTRPAATTFSVARVAAGGFGMTGSLGVRPTDAETARDRGAVFAKGVRQALSEVVKEIEPNLDGAGLLERGIVGGFRSMGMVAPGIAAAVATGGGSLVALPVMGAQTFGLSYARADDAGESFDSATIFAGIDAVVEVATEALPAKYFFGDIAANASFRKFFTHQMLSEGFGESIATTVQGLNEFLTFRPDEPITTYLEELPGQIAETLIATMTMVGVMSAAGKLVASQTGDGGRAKQAERDEQFFKDLRANVQASKTVARSPEAAEPLVADLANGAKVYAPPAAFETFFQDKTLDTPHGPVTGAAAIADELTGWSGALKEAIRSGVDLEIPLAAYALRLAGPAFAEFDQDVRRNDPNAMTTREFVAFKEAEVAKAAEPAVEEPATPDPVRQEILRKIQAAVAGTKIKLPAGAIEGYADVFEALTSTFEREGLDPVETLQKYGLLVVGPQEATPAPAKRPFKEMIAEMTAKRDAHVAAVSEVFAAEGGVKLTGKNGVTHLIHPSTREPGLIQVTSFTEDGTPSGHFNVKSIDEAARELQGDTLVRPETPAQAAPQAAGEAIVGEAPDVAARNAAARAEAAAAGPAYLDPVAIAAGRALAARLAVDKAKGPAQTEGADAEAGPEPSRLADPGRLSAAERVPARDPGRSKRAADKHLTRVFDVIHGAAQRVDPAVDPTELRSEFDYRVELLLERQSLASESENLDSEMLRAIAKMGGIAETEEGELRELRGKFGSVIGAPGIPGVFRTKARTGTANKKLAGLSLDVVLQGLQADPRFAFLESLDQLRDVLDEISRNGLADVSATELPGTEELRDVSIKTEKAWWLDSWRQAPEVEIDESATEGDTSFDVSTLDQVVTLFQDAPNEPTATYIGEQQDDQGGSVSLYNIVGGPRHKSTVTAETLEALGIPIPPKELEPALPGMEGFGGTAAELGELPFRLTAEIAATPSAKRMQRTLFQGLIETTESAAPKFYSRILRAVELSTQTKATGAQWIATIKNSKLGVNLDEFALTSVADLEAGKSYTKQDVLDYLAVHQVQVSEVILGGESTEPSAAEIDARRDWISAVAQQNYDQAVEKEAQRIYDRGGDTFRSVHVRVFEAFDDDEAGRWTFTLDGDADSYTYDTEKEAQEAADKEADAINAKREDAANAETRILAEESVDWHDFEADAADEWERNHEDDTDPTEVQFADDRYRLPGFEAGSYREAFVTADGTRLETTWEDGHSQYSNVVNPIVRLRFSTHMASVPLSEEEAAPLRAEAIVLDRERTAASKALHNLKFDIGDGVTTPEHVAEDRRLRALRNNAQAAIEIIDNKLDGPRKKLLFLDEVQPPSPDNQTSMPPIYLKNWREIGFKWALRYAAEHGYDGIAWTTGEQQAARYSLEKEVTEITWTKTEGTQAEDQAGVRQHISVTTVNGVIGFYIDEAGKVSRFGVDGRAAAWVGAPVENVLGKEIAEKIIGSRTRATDRDARQGEGQLKGEGLKVGGEGLKRLYDVDFVNVVNKLPAVKAHGGRVNQFDIGTAPDNFTVIKVFGGGGVQLAEQWGVNRQSGGSHANSTVQVYETFDEAHAHVVKLNAEKQPVMQPGLDLTPALKSAVLGGQTLFQDEKNLVIQHNLTAENLRHAVKMGGLPVPALAIANVDDALTNFGEITLLGHKEMADPRGYARTKVFAADIYSPRYPTIHYQISRAGEQKLAETLKPFSALTERNYFDLDSLQTEGARYLWREEPRVTAAFLASKGIAVEKTTTEVDEYRRGVDVANTMRRLVEQNNLDRELQAFADDLFASLNPVEKIFKGRTNAGNRSYQAHTLENVVAILKKNLRGDETSSNIYGVGQLRARFTKQFKSVKGITDARDRIVSDAAFDAVKKETGEELFAIADDLKSSYTSDANRFGFVDTVMAVMEDGATKGLPFALKDYGFANVPAETVQRIAGFMSKLRTMPTEYFEAKILREVDLAEFAAAVVPENTPADVIAMLEARGVEVTRYGQTGGEHDANVAAHKRAIAETAKRLGDKVLFQDEPPAAGKRGSITGSFDRNALFGPDLQFTIKLFENADVSTFLHESAHLFLKIMQDLEARPEATASLKADLAIIRARYGADGVEQQERFARAFEKYLLEGKAPSLQLRALFQNFRTWLLRLYRTMTALNVDLTDDVRGVFDRMLASDAAIAEAQAAVNATPMFTTPESARMSAEEFDVYQGKIAEAGTAAREKLEGKLLRDLQRQQRASYREEKQTIREAVEAEVYAMPVYQALAAMRKGTHPDGTPLVDGVPLEPLKLSRQVIIDRYGPERLAALPSYPPPIHTATGGMDPDTVAELFGFASGDALLVAVAEAVPMRGLIETETTKRMTAQAGDLMVDEKLSDLAKAAVANEHREAIVRIEMQTLGRLRRTAQAGAVKERDYERRWFEAEAKLRIAIAEGHQQVEIDALEAEVQGLKAQARGGAARINAALPTEAEMREVAKARIGRTRIRDLKPDLFHTAARRAGQQALEAAARQDFDAAIAAKQQEAISLALYREASRVVEDVEARVRAAQALDTPASRKRIGLAGGGFQEQIDAVLDRYQFARISGKALTKREALRAWVGQLEADGFSVDLPEDVLDDARRIHYRELSVDALVAVSDTLKSIVHLARLKNRLLKNKDARDFAVMRDKVAASIREHGKEKKLPVAFRKKEERRRSIKEWFASHARLATLVQVMDGKGDGGAMWSAFARPINEAVSAKETRMVAEATAYASILERHYPGRELGRMNDLMHIPAINDSLTLDERLTVAKNWGNETSRDRMLTDPKRKWNQKQIKAILDTLTANDLAYVQATFDFVNKFWPEITAKTKRLTGIEPEKVEAVPITAKNGTIAGGYYPLVADSRYNASSRRWEKVDEAKLRTSAAYVSQTTKRGHLETRKRHAAYTVKLEGGVLFSHLEQVIHDLTHHEMLIDVTRLLRDTKISDAIYDTQGDVVYDQLSGALEAIAAGKLAPAENMQDKAATFMRQRTQVALLGYNLWTAALQPVGIVNGIERVGVRWVARGVGRWLKDAATLENTVAWVHLVSPLMAGRHRTGTSDIRDVREALQTAGGWFDTLVRTVSGDALTQQRILDSFLWHIGLMQRVADMPTWLGQYEKSMAAGEPEDRAIAIADQAVIDSQGSGRISDLSTIERGRPVARMFLMFYSYGGATYNAAYRRSGQTNFKSPLQIATFLGGISLIYIWPSVITVALGQALRGGDDEDEEWLSRYMSDVGRESVASALNGMVLIRELSQVTSDAAVVLAGGEPKEGGVRGYTGPAGARPVSVMMQLLQQTQQGEADEGLWKALNAGAALWFRYPAAQVQRMIEGWQALQDDETDNPAALLFGPPRK